MRWPGLRSGPTGSVFTIETTPSEPLNRVAKRRLGHAVLGSNQVNPKLLFIDLTKAQKAQAQKNASNLLQSALGRIADI
jgi:hypothetical protein